MGECDSLRPFEAPFAALLLARIDWIDATRLQAASGRREFSRLGEADRIEASQAHLPLTAIKAVLEHPRLASAPGDLQVETRSVAIEARARHSLDPKRAQSGNRTHELENPR